MYAEQITKITREKFRYDYDYDGAFSFIQDCLPDTNTEISVTRLLEVDEHQLKKYFGW